MPREPSLDGLINVAPSGLLSLIEVLLWSKLVTEAEMLDFVEALEQPRIPRCGNVAELVKKLRAGLR